MQFFKGNCDKNIDEFEFKGDQFSTAQIHDE